MYSNQTATEQTLQQLKQLGFGLYYNPAVSIDHIRLLDRLSDIIEAANRWLAGTAQLDLNAQARLLNINRFAQSIARRGSCKPMMLNWSGQLPFEPGNGGTRMLAIEVIPTVVTVPAFITSIATLDLQPVQSLAQFKDLCHCVQGDVYVRLSASVGIEWYEAHSDDADLIMYSDQITAQALAQFIKHHNVKQFTKEWFATAVDWSHYFS